MNSPEPSDQLLQQWKPQNPIPSGPFVSDVMRQIRLRPPQNRWERIEGWLNDFFQNWLPQPQPFVPMALAILLLITGTSWMRAEGMVRERVAMTWYRQVSPFTQLSLTGNYQHSIGD